MDSTEPNSLPDLHTDLEPIQSAASIKPELKLIRALKNISPFTYSFTAVLAISLITLAYFVLQNLSLKSHLGMNSFMWPWTNATCTYQGTEFKPGESVPSVDGCNSCSCSEDGEVRCTLMACSSTDKDIETNELNDVKIFKNLEFPFSFNYPLDWDYYVNDNSIIHLDTKDHISYAKTYGCEDSKVLCSIWRTAISITITEHDTVINSNEFEQVEITPFASGSIEGVRYESTYLVDIPGGGPKGTKNISIKLKHNDKYLYIDLTDDRQINAFDQILSTFVFLDPTPSLDNPQPTLLQTSKIPLVDTSGWQTITQDGIVFQIPPSADFDNQSNPGNINWSWDYQNHILNANIKINISDYKGGSRREAFYSAFTAEDASTCKHIYKEATFGKVSALQIANDGGSCQGGGGGIVTTIGDKLVILPDLNYTSTSTDINRWDIRDTIISTLRAEK